MDKRKRSQISVEFIILFFMVFVFFSALSAATVKRMNMERESQRNWEAESILNILYSEVNNAGDSIGNYSRLFNLPKDLLGKNYTINITNDELIELTCESKNYYKWLKYKTEGQPKKGKNTIVKINNTIKLN